MPMDLRIGDRQYAIDKLNVKQQAKVVRKLMPFAKAIIPFIKTGERASLTSEDLVTMLGPLGDMIAAMPDKDWDDLIATCMSVVKRKDGVGWANVWNSAADMPMYSDMELPEILQLVGGVLKFNLGPFMAALPQALVTESPKPNDP